MLKMKKGDYVYTPRFCSVEIEKVYRNNNGKAQKDGYYEPTYYNDGTYKIYGKHTGKDLMTFAAIKIA
jgi:hypothetical protein